MNWVFRFLAYFVSIVFHPLLMLTYMLILLLIINPYLFGASVISQVDVFILTIFFSTFVLPGFSVVLMKLLGLVASIELKDKQERIGPYILAGVFYLWIYFNLLHNPDIPQAFKIFALGATIGLFGAFFFNLFFKVSMHGAGMGGLIGMIIITMLWYSYENFTIYLGGEVFQMSMHTVFMLVILLSGAVGTARLFLGAHQPKELYSGFLIGIFSQFIALLAIG